MLNITPNNHPLFALNCLLQGAKLLMHKELRKYLLVPVFINLVIYSIAFILGYHTISNLIHQLIPEWLSWLNWILWPLFFISFLVVGFFTFSLLANLIAAPYYSRLSAKTLQVISGVDTGQADQAWNQVFLGEFGRITYLLKRILPLLLLFLIPVVNLMAPILWTTFAAWGVAMEFMAYPLEDRGLLFAEQKTFMQKSRWDMLSFGAVVGLSLTTPIINLFAAQVAVMGATIYVFKSTQTQKGE